MRYKWLWRFFLNLVRLLFFRFSFGLRFRLWHRLRFFHRLFLRFLGCGRVSLSLWLLLWCCLISRLVFGLVGGLAFRLRVRLWWLRRSSLLGWVCSFGGRFSDLLLELLNLLFFLFLSILSLFCFHSLHSLFDFHLFLNLALLVFELLNKASLRLFLFLLGSL